MATVLLVAACGGSDDEGAAPGCSGDRGLSRDVAQRLTDELLALAEAVAQHADEPIRDLVETAERVGDEHEPSGDDAQCSDPSLEDTEFYSLTILHLAAHPELATPELVEFIHEAAESGGPSGVTARVIWDDDLDDPPPEIWDVRAAVREQRSLLHDRTGERSRDG
jgi:hypothetical protein